MTSSNFVKAGGAGMTFSWYTKDSTKVAVNFTSSP